MKTVILKGQEITIGSEVRFVDDRDMYADVPSINKPIVGNVYVVKEFSKNGGFLFSEMELNCWRTCGNVIRQKNLRHYSQESQQMPY